MTKWQANRKGWEDVGAEVSDQLEYAWLKGFPKCGIWDNGLFREFDLNTLKEVPGILEIRRVRKASAPVQSDAPALKVRPRPTTSSL